MYLNKIYTTLIFVLASIFIISTSLIITAQEYQQSPVLEKMVDEGSIPDIEERLPDEPEVVEPIDSVGNYGGTARVFNAEAPSRPYTAQMLMGSHGPFKASPEAEPGVPNVFKGYDVNEDFTEWTFYLREGLKWSDGHELTSENFLLYWKYDRAEPDINPSVNPEDVVIEENSVTFTNEHGKNRTVKKEVIDKYTIRYSSEEPYPLLINHLSHPHSDEYNILPMHFMKQFHPEFVGEETAEEIADKAGFDTWFQLYENFTNRQGQQSTVQVLGNFPPTLNSYVCVEKTQTKLIFERNPYYYKVDPEGRQLPYIDRIIVNHVSEREIINGKIMSGEVDFEGFMTQTPDIPFYKKYEKDGSYHTDLWNFAANASVYHINYSYEDEVVRNLFRNKNFRKALSFSINRDRINNEILFGKAKPLRISVMEDTMWYESEYENKYAEYDPEKAKTILDDLGVVDQDNDGWREDPDGNNITWTVEYIVSEAPRQEISEIVRKNWNDIGLNVEVKQVEANLGFTRTETNEMAMWIWHGDARTEMMFPVNLNAHIFSNWIGQSWYSWWTTDGDTGDEPPEDVKQLYSWYDALTRSTSKEEMTELGKKMLENAAENIWTISTANNFPHPMIVKNDLMNFPTEEDGPLYYIWSTWWTNAYEPAQFYFENRSTIQYEDSGLPDIYPLDIRMSDPVERALENGWL